MNKWIFVSVVLLGGCAATPEQIYMPDGTSAFVVRCDSPKIWADCYSSAGAHCGQSGYVVLAEQTDVIGGSMVVSGGIASARGPRRTHAMFYRCKDPQ